MFEKFNSTNSENFRQRYQGTYGFYRDGSGKRTLVKVVSVDDQRVEFVDARGVDYRLHADNTSGIGFEFLPPKSVYYATTSGNVYLVLRVAARQFLRGICDKNTRVYKLYKGGLLGVRVDFTSLADIYLNQVPYNAASLPLDKITLANADAPGLALSHQFAMCLGLVYLFDKTIGTYTVNNTQINITLYDRGLWGTELGDSLTAMGLQFTIEENK